MTTAPAPDPYRYPPYEIITQDLTYTPVIETDPDAVQYYMGLANNRTQIQNDDSGVSGATWCPRWGIRGSDGCNLVSLLSEQTSDFVYATLPPGRLTKIVITVLLDSPLVTGDFDPTTTFFTTLPTTYVEGVSDSKRPFWIGYVRGSTNTLAFRENDRLANGEMNQHREPSVVPRNFPLLWYSYDELVAETELRVESTFNLRDTYTFTLDTSMRGILLESGDKLKYYCGQGGFIPKVRGLYIRYEFAKQAKPGVNIPYTTSGMKST